MSVSLELARRLHALGLSVIPLQPKSKLPDVLVLPKDENGDPTWKPFQTTRCTDDDLIAWFGNGQSRNAGIVLGAVSGVVVIESDTPVAEAWCAENLRPTPMMTASARGFHRYYKLPNALREDASSLPAHIDASGLNVELKRDGQYVVAPDSVHPTGHVYVMVEDWPSNLDDLPLLPYDVIVGSSSHPRQGKLLHVPHVPMLKEANPRSGFFDDDQIEAVIGHLPAHLKPVVRFGYVTGWRVSEVLKLEWRQVDMKAEEVRLDPGTTKNREGRVFPFTAELRDLFKLLHQDHDALKKKGTIGRYVFHRPHAPNQRIKSLRKPWETACKKAGCPGRLFHDLRRSAARNFVRSGIPERVAMRLLGHKTRSIFDRYNIVSSGDLLDAARKLDVASTVTGTVTTAGDNRAK